MCGLAGVVFGTKRRRPAEREHLKAIFAGLLLASEARGTDASGVALLDRDGGCAVVKQAVPASELVVTRDYKDLLSAVDNRTTVLMGHTRWRTRGHERNHRNNHPLVGECVLTHNGTITNADELFRESGWRRTAEVDSEILLRMADASLVDGRIDVPAFLRRVARCEGRLSAVLVSRHDPGTALLLKGNNPLEIRHHPGYRATMWASETRFLEVATGGEDGWEDLGLFPMCWARVSVAAVGKVETDWFGFRASGELPLMRVRPRL